MYKKEHLEEDPEVAARSLIKQLELFEGLPADLESLYQSINDQIKSMSKSLDSDTYSKLIELFRTTMAQSMIKTRQRLHSNKTRQFLLKKSMGSKSSSATPVVAMADDITTRLLRMTSSMRQETDRASESFAMFEQGSNKLNQTNELYTSFGTTVKQSKGLVSDLSNIDARDRRRVKLAFWFLLAVVAYVIIQRAHLGTSLLWPWNWIRLIIRMVMYMWSMTMTRSKYSNAMRQPPLNPPQQEPPVQYLPLKKDL